MRLIKSGRKTNRLTNRVRAIYFLMPALLIGVVLLVGSHTSRVIADDVAERMSRQYSIEAAANFQTFMNPHMLLMQQMSYSTAIARWLAHEDNSIYKDSAFEAMRGHAVTWPYAYFMFTSYESLRGFNFDLDLTRDEFVSWGTLTYGTDASQWFFDTRDAEAMFILNIQRTRPDEYGNWDLYIWSNHRIYYRDDFVGVFTIGSPFAGVYYATFGGFDSATRRGYLIDRYGMVRLDSAGILETTVDGLPSFPYVPESAYNPSLMYELYTHVQRLDGGLFRLGTPTCEAIGLEGGDFRYASITPIIGTDWAVLVLSGHEVLFDTRYMPLIFVTVSLLILYAFLSSAVIRKIILVPLETLARSTIEVGTHFKASLYGVERDDEIGILAHTIKHSQDTLIKREQMLNTINETAQILLTSNVDTAEAVAKSMEIVGKSVDACRVHLWKNEMVNGELHFVLTHNWVSPRDKWDGVIFEGMSFPYSERPEWLAALRNGERINGPISEFHPENTAFLNGHMVKSIAIVPLLIDNELFGSISVSDCEKERVFTNEEMEMFASTGLMFANAMIRSEQSDAVLQALNAERDAHNFNQTILDAAPFVIGIWSEDGRPVAGNKQTAELFKIDDPSVLTNNLYAFSPEFQPCGTPSPEKASMYYKKAFEDGYVRFEWMHKRADGVLLPVEVIYKTYVRKGKTMLMSYTMDLTAIKNAMAEVQRIEVAEESNRAKSRFLAQMSHEIRTPITAVLGISEIELRSQALSPHMREAFSKIHDSAKILLNIVNDVLDFSKIESGKMSIVNDEYAVASLANDAAQLHIVYLEHRDITFTLQIDEHIPVRLIGDALRIKQIINNLISNAFKYTESGSVSLAFGYGNETDEYMNLDIIVEDTGFGMNAEQLEAIKTSEYTRFHEREERFISGTGLGVPIVYNLVDMMDGVIEFESEVGKGTKVRVSIPQQKCGAEELGKEAAQNLQNFDSYTWSSAMKTMEFVPEPMPYGKVLVVDDVDANLFVARGLLSFYDLNIDTCTNGHSAIDKVKQGEVYDIIFMDHLMPGINGSEVMQIMRDMGYDKPIIVLTANALVGQEEEFLQLGFDDFISKPIQTKRLNELLIKYIRDKQPPEVIATAKASAKSSTRGSGIDDFLNNEDISKRLRGDFARSHKNAFRSIIQAMEAGDTATAHRLAHTVKGAAGLIGESALVQIAGNVEDSFASGETPTDTALFALENELNRVVENINIPNADERPSGAVLDIEHMEKLLAELEPLLKSNDATSLEYTEELRAFPESAILTRQIEDFDFKLAAESLAALRKVWNI